LTTLVTQWRASATRGAMHLKTKWFPQAVNDIRAAAMKENLTLARRHAVIHAFNNLTASKVKFFMHNKLVYAFIGIQEIILH